MDFFLNKHPVLKKYLVKYLGVSFHIFVFQVVDEGSMGNKGHSKWGRILTVGA